MKKLSLILIIVFLFAGMSFAKDITFLWDANTEADLAGYRFYHGGSPGVYDDFIDVGNVTTYTVSIEEDCNCYFAVTAYDTAGNESGFSNEVMDIVNEASPNNPTNFRK